MLPLASLSSVPIEAPMLPPDDVDRSDVTRDYERGGVALNDPTQGLNVRDWWAFITDEAHIWVASVDGVHAPALQLSGADITEVSLAFDQNMQPVLAYVEGGVVKLWWWDSLIPGRTITSFPGAVGPLLTLDDKRRLATLENSNDVIMAYVRDGNAYFRQQRDRYGVEYLLGEVPPMDDPRIMQIGMGYNQRLQFKIKQPPSARYTDLATDTLYILNGGGIRGIGKGDVRNAIWRSKTHEFHEQPSPSWLRIEGDYPLQVRLIGDGQVYYTTPAITGPDPVRIPARRWREWALEVFGTKRVVDVGLAHSREEFL
jgi:hypothetical protein